MTGDDIDDVPALAAADVGHSYGNRYRCRHEKRGHYVSQRRPVRYCSRSQAIHGNHEQYPTKTGLRVY
ncbi:hypothetical protein SAMN05421882_10064 [Nitrosomonas communis]|uniref:Uncharacterized protein n=1 Tax=Nitrosomonas communis TaxID=44574 RepID=A0A1H2S294_9PROT|nr:hypothetical protein SAMN05421882_10064 [Nitrosomonas communis]